MASVDNITYRYIDLVDQLRTYGLEKEFPLPQVVVLGVQSSGKSSVLEAISGVQLPRGTGDSQCTHDRCTKSVISDLTLWTEIRQKELNHFVKEL